MSVTALLSLDGVTIGEGLVMPGWLQCDMNNSMLTTCNTTVVHLSHDAKQK